MQMNGQIIPSPEALGALPISDVINSIVGTTATLLTRPSGATMLILLAETNNWRIRSGDCIAKTFTTVSAANDTATVTAHGYFNGFGPVQLTTSGALPTGLSTSTDYWIIKVDDNTIKFASSKANADANTPVAIDLTGAGSGTQTIAASMPSTEAPAATITNGANGILLKMNNILTTTCKQVTVKGYDATSVLSYYWV